MDKANFVESYKAARRAFEASLDGLTDQEAGVITGPATGWPTIKDLIGHIAAWEREVLVADEMIKRGEESYLDSIEIDDFNQAQAAHRRGWSLAQLRSELDLNYEALLMAWDEYEGEDGPHGPATWLPGRQPGSLWSVIYHQVGHGREIAARRNLTIDFPEFNIQS